MAVPSSGTLRLAGLAAEKDTQTDYDDYDYDDVLSLKDITVGGNANGNHFSVDVTNTNSTLHPDNSAPYKMSEFYGYDHDEAGLAFNLTTAEQVSVFRYFNTPSPDPCSVQLSTTSSLGTVRHTPKYNTTVSGTPTKRGSVTSTSPNPTVTQAYINNAVNSWTPCASGTASNGFQYGITYYTRIWASKGLVSNTVYTNHAQWSFVGLPTVTTQAASNTATGFTMNGNLTDVGLGTNPASGAVHGITARGFVYSTSQSTPTYYNATIAQTGSSRGVFNTGSYSTNVTTSTAGTYYIRAFVKTEDVNTGYNSPVEQIAYGSVVTIVKTASRTGYLTTGSMPRPSATCYVEEELTTRYFSDSTPAVGDTVYTSSTGSGTLSAGHYGYAVNSLTTNRSITVNSSGVITAHSICAIP